MDRMPLPHNGTTTRPSAAASVIVVAAAVFTIAVAIVAAGLWVHYGTAVFFEMIKSGIAACV
jgi:hypothetical protein